MAQVRRFGGANLQDWVAKQAPGPDRAKNPAMRLLVRSLLLAGLLLPAAAAQAAESPVFALKPVGHNALGYYRFAANPGERVDGQVRVVNAGSVEGTAELAVVDGTTGATTGAVYRTVGSASSDVGAWLQLSAREVTLAPGASTLVPFTVTVPSDGRRGEHLGGIVARPAASAPGKTNGTGKHSFRVDVVDQSILAVQVDLPGAARGLLKVRGVEAGGNPGYQTLQLALSNPGELMVKGRGTVEVTRAGGEVVTTQDFPIDTFLPRTRISYPLVLRGDALLPDDYRARVVLHWDGGQTSTTELPFTLTDRNIEQAYGSAGVAKLPGHQAGGSTPVALLAGGGLLVVLLGFGGMAWYFRRRTRDLERRLGAAVVVPDPDEVAVTDARGERAGRR
ncbi:MAG: putative protein of unknown function cell surface [Solirubrobacterales bacterium]|nr:putative protein of unknown function cell surface [Solirubrobacterales bacterium]